MLDPALLNIIVPAVVSVATAVLTVATARARLNNQLAALQAENEALKKQIERTEAEFGKQIEDMKARYVTLKEDHDALLTRYEAALKAQAGWRGSF